MIDCRTLKYSWMSLLESNRDLPICRKTLELRINEQQIIFLAMVANFINEGVEKAGLSLLGLGRLFGLGTALAPIPNHSPLITGGYIEEKVEDGMVDTDVYVVSRQIMNTYLSKFSVKGTFCSLISLRVSRTKLSSLYVISFSFNPNFIYKFPCSSYSISYYNTVF